MDVILVLETSEATQFDEWVQAAERFLNNFSDGIGNAITQGNVVQLAKLLLSAGVLIIVVIVALFVVLVLIAMISNGVSELCGGIKNDLKRKFKRGNAEIQKATPTATPTPTTSASTPAPSPANPLDDCLPKQAPCVKRTQSGYEYYWDRND